MNFSEALKAGKTSPEEALSIFDALEPVDIDFMIGLWQGSGFPSGHPMDGLLESSGWYGKSFRDAESAHPLLFHTADGKGVFALDPLKMPTGADARKPAEIQYEVETHDYKARLRMTVFRGKLSATMIYDDRPINDIFHKVDDNTVLGAMDIRGLSQTYFFVLRRVTSAEPL